VSDIRRASRRLSTPTTSENVTSVAPASASVTSPPTTGDRCHVGDAQERHHDHHHDDSGPRESDQRPAAGAHSNTTNMLEKESATMATAKQIAANRGNARRSTGPRTPEGRKASAMNALKHGMTSQTVLLPDEDPREFEHFASGMRLYWSPFGAQEDVLVERIIHLAWRLVRLGKIEAGILTVGYCRVDAGAQSENIVAAVFAEYTAKGILEKLCRYESSKERSLSRTIHDLERLQDRRRKEATLPLAQQMSRAREEMRSLAAEVERIGEIGILDSEPRVNDANAPAGGNATAKAVMQSRAQITDAN
jgi:hypothetical protein